MAQLRPFQRYVQEVDEMLAVIASTTSGQGVITNSGLGPALDAAGIPEFASEISVKGRGAIIYHSLALEGTVLARDFAVCLCLERKCSRVSDAGSQEILLNFFLHFCSASM